MKEMLISLMIAYLLLMSIIGFVIMGIDKQRAIKKKWRIPESTLILIAFAGGGLGAFFGMYVFRHKTKHMKFVVLLPLSAVLYVIIGIQLMKLL